MNRPDEWDTFCFRLGWITGAMRNPGFVAYLKTIGAKQEEIDAFYKDGMLLAEAVHRFRD